MLFFFELRMHRTRRFYILSFFTYYLYFLLWQYGAYCISNVGGVYVLPVYPHSIDV